MASSASSLSILSTDAGTTDPWATDMTETTPANIPLPPSLPGSRPPSISSATSTLPSGSPAPLHRQHGQGNVPYPAMTMPSTMSFSTSIHAPLHPQTPTGHHFSIPPAPQAFAVEAMIDKDPYTLSDRTSTLLQTTGHVPPPRIGATTTIHNNFLYLFGGRIPGQGPTNDLYQLNLETLVWTLIDYSQDPLQTYSVSPSPQGSLLEERQHPLSPLAHQPVHQRTPHPNSIVPRPRYFHSAVLVVAPPLLENQHTLKGWGGEQSAHLVIFGGLTVQDSTQECASTEICLNDAHILDLDSLKWIPTRLAGDTLLDAKEGSQTEMTTVKDPAPVTSQTRDNDLHEEEVSPRSIESVLTKADSGLASEEERPQKSDQDDSLASTQLPEPLQSVHGPLSPTTLNKVASTSEHPPIHNPFHYHQPPPRFAHVATLSGDQMVILGGRGQDREHIMDVSVLDLRTHFWMMGGTLHSRCSQGRSALASVEERPMARRRRRYLDSLAIESGSISSQGSVAASFASDTSSIIPAPTSAILNPLLNPRKNSWHRGEGHPFEAPNLQSDPSRRRFHSDTGLVPHIMPGDHVWAQQAILQENPELIKAHGLVGLGMDPEISQAMAKSAGVAMTTQDALARSRKTSLSSGHDLSMAPPTSSSAASLRAESAKSTPRSRTMTPTPSSPITTKTSSRTQSQPTSSSTTPTPSSTRSPAPVMHATSSKFFSKSGSAMFDLDNLATVVAREHTYARSPTPKKKEISGKSSSPRTSTTNRTSTGSTTSHPSFRDGRRGSHNSLNSADSSRRSSVVHDDSSAKKQLGSTSQGSKDSLPLRSAKTSLDLGSSRQRASSDEADEARSGFTAAAILPSYLYSSFQGEDGRTHREFVKVQATKGCCRPDSGKVCYDIKPEWAALDVSSGLLASMEGLLPPRMLFPLGEVIDHHFLLSGSHWVDHPSPSEEPIEGVQKQPVPQQTFAVWIHHLNNHQWTQLDLRKYLSMGLWSQSVLDRTTNALYVIGKHIDSGTTKNEKDDGESEPHNSVEHSSQSSPTKSPGSLHSKDGVQATTFSHMLKVDLEAFEICPAVDEPSIGSAGVKLGLNMLKDGIAADVVLVSSADGGRVRVNSGIVGQRWGYFQTLMEERDRMRAMEAEDRQSRVSTSSATQSIAAEGADTAESSVSVEKVETVQEQPKEADHSNLMDDPVKLASRRWYLSDRPAEIIVREPMPILVGFLQYIYTNELVTPHQLKLKTLQGLLLLAHLYDLTRLQQLVRRALYQQLNASNAHSICEVAVLTHEFGLHTRALRTILQGARLAKLRRQGEAAEAKRRLEFAMSRLEEIEVDRKRKASIQAIQASQALLRQTAQGISHPGSVPNGTTVRPGSTGSSLNASASSTPGLGSIGRFFRGREESIESALPSNQGSVVSGPAAAAVPIGGPDLPELGFYGGSAVALAQRAFPDTTAARLRTTSGTAHDMRSSGHQQKHIRSKSMHYPLAGMEAVPTFGSQDLPWTLSNHATTYSSSPHLPPAPPIMRSQQANSSHGSLLPLTHGQISPRISTTSSQNRAMTAPTTTPSPSSSHLTLGQKIHRKLSSKAHPPALDYFRTSHYGSSQPRESLEQDPTHPPVRTPDAPAISPGPTFPLAQSPPPSQQQQKVLMGTFPQPPVSGAEVYSPGNVSIRSAGSRYSLSNSSLQSMESGGTGGGSFQGTDYGSSLLGSIASSSSRSLPMEDLSNGSAGAGYSSSHRPSLEGSSSQEVKDRQRQERRTAERKASANGSASSSQINMMSGRDSSLLG